MTNYCCAWCETPTDSNGKPVNIIEDDTYAYCQRADKVNGECCSGPAPIGEDSRPKDRVKLGLSPSTVIEEIDCREGN